MGTGNVQVAKQTLRQVLRYDSYLDAATCFELAVVLLRCSQESRAGPGERTWLVQDGRYAAETIMVANLMKSLRDCGEVHYILGLAHILSGSDTAALPELQAAVPWFNHDTPCQDEINNVIRECARRLNSAGNAVGPITVAPAPPRTDAQVKEFRKRLQETRDGGNPVGLANFAQWESGFEVYDHDLPEILEAVAEGRVRMLSLRAARIGVWGVKEIVVRIRESPGCLQEVDVSRCAAVGELGKELVNSYPYKRGVSMEASETGLPEEDVVQLRNRNEDSEKALRRAAAEQQRSASLCEEYLAKQAILQQLAVEESNTDPPPERPLPAYYPSRWIEGIELRAQQDYKSFIAVNPQWAISGSEYYDVPESVDRTIISITGESIAFDNDDVWTVLQQKRVNMLKEEGYVEDVFEEEEGEYDPREYDMDDRVDRRRTNAVSKMPPPFYAAVFGGQNNSGARGPDRESIIYDSVLHSQRLIGFMIYLGVRASPDEVAVAKEERGVRG